MAWTVTLREINVRNPSGFIATRSLCHGCPVYRSFFSAQDSPSIFCPIFFRLRLRLSLLKSTIWLARAQLTQTQTQTQTHFIIFARQTDSISDSDSSLLSDCFHRLRLGPRLRLRLIYLKSTIWLARAPLRLTPRAQPTQRLQRLTEDLSMTRKDPSRSKPVQR